MQAKTKVVGGNLAAAVISSALEYGQLPILFFSSVYNTFSD